VVILQILLEFMDMEYSPRFLDPNLHDTFNTFLWQSNNNFNTPDQLNTVPNFIPETQNTRSALITCSNSHIEMGESFSFAVELQDQYSKRILEDFPLYFSINYGPIEHITIEQGYSLFSLTPNKIGEHTIHLYENPNLSSAVESIVTCRRSLLINIRSFKQHNIIPRKESVYYEVKKDPVLNLQFEITNTKYQVADINGQFNIILYGITTTNESPISLQEHVQIIENRILQGFGIVRMRFLQVSSKISFQYFILEFSLNDQQFEKYQPVYFPFYVRSKHRK